MTAAERCLSRSLYATEGYFIYMSLYVTSLYITSANVYLTRMRLDRLHVYTETIIDDKGSSRGSEMQKATTLLYGLDIDVRYI